MKKQRKWKALVLSMVMAVGMLLPMTMNAQSDGFFRGNGDNYMNREGGVSIGGMTGDNPDAGITIGGLTPETPSAPLGNGLVVMLAASACYTLIKKLDR